jgi:trk system potassium uptake protein TrkH
MLYFLGFILLIIGGVMVVPAIASVLLNETFLIPYFLVPAVVALIIGILLRLFFKKTELSLGKAMVLVTAAWLLFALLSTVPFVFGTQKLRGGAANPTPMSPIDGYFESMSGFTATGLTMIPTDPTSPFNIETCPTTILFWRSLTEWVGGMGIIVLFLTALIGMGKAARKMYVAEARIEAIEPSIKETARSLWKIYVVLTLIGAVGLYFAGSTLFESINHSMTAIATGGFSVRNASFSGYSVPILLITIWLMMAGATSFALHKRIWSGKWRELFRNVEVQFMLVLIVLGTVAVGFTIGVTHGLFQSVSALSGTGFSTTGLRAIGDFPKLMLTVFMIVGGGYGSTSSAIKLIRCLIILKAVHWSIKKSFLPERAVVPMKLGGRIYEEHEMREVSTYAIIYIFVLIGGALALMLIGTQAAQADQPKYTGINSMFESASAQGNVGLSVGITSATMPAAGKVVLTIQMLVGRLEIIPVLAFLNFLFLRSIRRLPGV